MCFKKKSTFKLRSFPRILEYPFHYYYCSQKGFQNLSNSFLNIFNETGFFCFDFFLFFIDQMPPYGISMFNFSSKDKTKWLPDFPRVRIKEMVSESWRLNIMIDPPRCFRSVIQGSQLKQKGH